jgi:DNA-binding HxlR family transcriptional regulator
VTKRSRYAAVVKRASFADMNCSVAQTLEVVGEWWTLLIVRDAFLGISRFEDFHQRLGISRNILAARLDSLVEHGVIERRTYSEHPLRHDYVLTAKGRDLWRVLAALRQWGDRWIAGRGHESVVTVHDGCGKRTVPELHCSKCGDKLKGPDLHHRAGPGASDPDFVPTG